MIRNWYYSLLMLAAYVSLFVFWKYFPSRSGFLLGGLAVASLLCLGFVYAWRRGYFTSRVDKCLHAYVIADVALESAAFELFRLSVAHGSAMVGQFHENNNFVGCTLVLTALVGGHRWWSLRKRVVADRPATEDANSRGHVVAEPKPELVQA